MMRKEASGVVSPLSDTTPLALNNPGAFVTTN
jgi:hypothetical protein